jgi:hypothetical protein
MATNDNGINLIDEQHEKNDGRKALALGTLVALGVAGAMGLGFILRGDGAPTGEVLSGQTEPTRIVRTTPTTATGQQGGPQEEPSPQTGGHGEDSAATDGDGEAVEPPPPTNTPAPTGTPVPPTETPVPPTETPTNTPTATATPSGECAFCPDLDLVLIDFFAPVFESGGRTHCPEGTIVAVTLNETADIWVAYTFFGADQATSVQHGTFGIFNLGGGPFFFPAMNILVHAEDAFGNTSTFVPPLYDC